MPRLGMVDVQIAELKPAILKSMLRMPPSLPSRVGRKLPEIQQDQGSMLRSVMVVLPRAVRLMEISEF